MTYLSIAAVWIFLLASWMVRSNTGPNFMTLGLALIGIVCMINNPPAVAALIRFLKPPKGKAAL